MEHALVARRLAARIPAVREAVGIAAYLGGDWQLAIAELRTYHRLSGKQTHIAMIADCERAQERPEKAIDLYRNADQSALTRGEQLELLIVAAGARMDMDQPDAALTMLRVPELDGADDAEEAARLRYAYADILLATGRRDEAYEWFTKAAVADTEDETDAADRLLELDGVDIEELEDDEFNGDEGETAAAVGDKEDSSDGDEDDEDDIEDEFDDEFDDDDDANASDVIVEKERKESPEA
ncbi:MAG: Replicase polyprotein 1ab [Longispora sp.]|nr:Replicase polyprotein 1ab [Longispora sp. (in: high G+C Gram-positive bacteria)]